MRELIVINEVGLRDGLQNQKAAVSCDDKLRLLNALLASGLRSFEVTSFVSPKAVPQMADAEQLYASLPQIAEVQYSALVPNERGLERASGANVQEIAVVLSATQTMNERNIRMDLAQARRVAGDTIIAAQRLGIRTKAYIAVAFECPFEGLVPVARVLELAEEMVAAGADEIVIADTIGAASPKQVSDVFRQCVAQFGAHRLSAHFHDTRAFGLANVWAALEQGLRKFDASVGGLGGCPFSPGAAGNVATEDVVLMLEQCGFDTKVDITAIRAAVAVASEVVGHQVGGRTSAWSASQAQK